MAKEFKEIVSDVRAHADLASQEIRVAYNAFFLWT